MTYRIYWSYHEVPPKIHTSSAAFRELLVCWSCDPEQPEGHSRHCGPTLLTPSTLSWPRHKAEARTCPINQGSSGHAQWIQGWKEKPALREEFHGRYQLSSALCWIYSFRFHFTWQHFPPSPTWPGSNLIPPPPIIYPAVTSVTPWPTFSGKNCCSP